MLVGIVLLAVSLFFLMKDNQKGLAIITVISLFNDLFEIPFIGIKPYQFISLIYSFKTIGYWIRHADYLKRIILPLLLEYYYLIILGILFGFIYPWRGDHDYLRSWSQLAEGRAIVQLVKIFSEISLLFLTFYWIHSGKVTLRFLIRTVALILSAMVAIAVIDGLSGYRIRLLLFTEHARLIEGRFIGLNGEPRYLGRACSYALLLLLVFRQQFNDKYVNAGILFSIAGILISFSASAYVLSIVWFMILLLYRTVKWSFPTLLYSVLIALAFIYTINTTDFVTDTTLNKIQKVAGFKKEFSEKVDRHEPDIFSRFEVFDRAALNFLYREPVYAFYGTGPNLISIPSSPYTTKYAHAIYGHNLDSVPHSFFINLISRSGVVGLFLWFGFFIMMYRLIGRDHRIIPLFVAVFVSTMFVSVPIFYFCLGFILSVHFIKHKSYD